MKTSNTPGISFLFIWVYCRLLPWQQTIAKITIFLLFSIYLLPFLELASVKYLETRQSCENDFGQYFNLKKWKIPDLGDSSKSYKFLFYFWLKKEILRWNFVKKLYCEVGIYIMFTKFHRRKHEKSERLLSSFSCLTSYNFETTTRACVSQTHCGHWRAWAFEREGSLVCPILKLLLSILRHVLEMKI